MKNFVRILALFMTIFIVYSCGEDYLDIVPDDRATEDDAFKDPNAARDYLYSIYGYMPDPRVSDESIDLFTTDQTVTSFDDDDTKVTRGEYTASNPTHEYWHSLYQGIRQAYIFLNRIEEVPDLASNKVKEYEAEATFLVGYLHFLLLRMYGPVVIVDKEYEVGTSLDPESFPARSSYDEGVDFIVNKLDEASKGLPLKQGSGEYGRATSVIAKAIKARLLLYAASPQFNGGGPDKQSMYTGFLDEDGNELISTTFDKEKWKRAADAARDAIDIAESAGYSLYSNSTYNLDVPQDPVQKDLRFTFIDKNSNEVIWAEPRTESIYGLQNNAAPYSEGFNWNSYGPPLETVEDFYTKNGLPIDKDPDFDYSGRYDLAANENGSVLKQFLNREPRFYAWIGFHNGIYEVPRDGQSSIVTRFRFNDPQGMQDRNRNFSYTGFLNKKGVSPELVGDAYTIVDYPWPKIRLAELYLNYAEALIEYGDQFSIAKDYIDRIRNRAGIPSIDESWASIGGANDQSTLREIVRQERTIEFYFENQRFWDLRRWQIAEDYLDVPLHGMNIYGETDEEFLRKEEIKVIRHFNRDAHYLMPIPQSEIDKNERMIQNPGY